MDSGIVLPLSHLGRQRELPLSFLDVRMVLSTEGQANATKSRFASNPASQGATMGAWVSRTKKLKTELQMPDSFVGDRQAQQAMTTRAFEILKLAQWVHRDKLDALYVDLSQGIERKPWKVGMVGTLNRSAQIWVNARQSYLLPKERLFLLGWHRDVNVSNLLEVHLVDLAGDAMCLPCIGVVLFSIWHCMPWPPTA